MSSNLAAVFRYCRFGRFAGIGLFVASLLTYRSYANRTVFGLWSYSFFIFIIVSIGWLVADAVRLWRVQQSQEPNNGVSQLLFNAATALWCLSYFLSALDDRINAARISELNVFGSVMPTAALLEWVSLLLLVALAFFKLPRTNKRLMNTGLAIATVVFLVVLGEGIARILAVVDPIAQEFPSYRNELWGRRYTSLNKQGFRDVEHGTERGPETRRLLIVGDSFAYGWGIKSISDRFGEKLARKLYDAEGKPWEAINASEPDTHTLNHIEFLERMLVYRPDVVLLLYVFNDIDYLQSVTYRQDPVNSSRSLLRRFHPFRVLYKNSYLFQETYIRLRLILYKFFNGGPIDPYNDAVTVSRHLEDLARFAASATQIGATVAIVPFDPRVTQFESSRHRYDNFVNRASAAGIPILSLDGAFDGHQFNELVVNELDAHPNELANDLAARLVANRLLEDWSQRPEAKKELN
jgi:hypothetical protein